LCSCGKEVIRTSGNLNGKNKTQSCGCIKRERQIHGHSANGIVSKTYRSWAAMIARCTNPNNNRYGYYAGRGIVVCERWTNSFPNFLADMGERPIGKSIDRINNDGNYEPGNCRWSTAIEQVHNRRPFKRRNQWSKKISSTMRPSSAAWTKCTPRWPANENRVTVPAHGHRPAPDSPVAKVAAAGLPA
jgi:hypothetical protein